MLKSEQREVHAPKDGVLCGCLQLCQHHQIMQCSDSARLELIAPMSSISSHPWCVTSTSPCCMHLSSSAHLPVQVNKCLVPSKSSCAPSHMTSLAIPGSPTTSNMLADVFHHQLHSKKYVLGHCGRKQMFTR